jgi:hypothetical protein
MDPLLSETSAVVGAEDNDTNANAVNSVFDSVIEA